FTIWTVGSVKAIPMEAWQACAGRVDPAAWLESRLQQLHGKRCWGGLDLGSTSDLTAFVLLFPVERWLEVLCWFWVPRESARRRTEEARVPYQQWIREGWIRVTEGDLTDYDVVRRDIGRLGEDFSIVDIGVDHRFQGAQLCTQLAADGFEIVSFGQSFTAL